MNRLERSLNHVEERLNHLENEVEKKLGKGSFISKAAKKIAAFGAGAGATAYKKLHSR